MRVLVTGGTGFIGKHLVTELCRRGIEVHVLTRQSRESDACISYLPYPRAGRPWPLELFDSVDGVVNLAGYGLATQRWNEAVKEEILQSRVQTTQQLAECLQRRRRQGLSVPAVLVSASAIGFYGNDGDYEFTEAAPSGADFLARVCRQWEEAAQGAAAAGVRVVVLRMGHVLGHGGLLRRLEQPFLYGVGVGLGDGRQWLPWIHMDDLCALLVRSLLQPEMEGAYNACTPRPVRMDQLAHALGKVLHSPVRGNVPACLARLAWGELAEEVLLQGQKVLPQRLMGAGFSFQYAELGAALAQLYARR